MQVVSRRMKEKIKLQTVKKDMHVIFQRKENLISTFQPQKY